MPRFGDTEGDLYAGTRLVFVDDTYSASPSSLETDVITSELDPEEIVFELTITAADGLVNRVILDGADAAELIRALLIYRTI